MGTPLPATRRASWTDLEFGRNGRIALALAPVTVPPIAATRRPRRDNADVAVFDHAIRVTGRVAGPLAVLVLTFLLSLPWFVPDRAGASERVAIAQVVIAGGGR